MSNQIRWKIIFQPIHPCHDRTCKVQKRGDPFTSPDHRPSSTTVACLPYPEPTAQIASRSTSNGAGETRVSSDWTPSALPPHDTCTKKMLKFSRENSNYDKEVQYEIEDRQKGQSFLKSALSIYATSTSWIIFSLPPSLSLSYAHVIHPSIHLRRSCRSTASLLLPS